MATGIIITTTVIDASLRQLKASRTEKDTMHQTYTDAKSNLE